MTTRTRNITELALCVFNCEMAGILGSLITFPSITGWYGGLVRPSFSPPNWVFGPVWTTLFAMMGIALFLVLRHHGAAKRRAVWFFGIQLFLNVLWSVMFFGFHSTTGASIEIVFLWAAIVGTIAEFYPVDKAAAYLLVPYLLWVSFASALTFSIWSLNMM